MSFLKWFLGTQETYPAPQSGQQPAPPEAEVGGDTTGANNVQEHPQGESTPAEVIAQASVRLGKFANTVPPRALFPAFEMVETYRKITGETEASAHWALPETTSYTLHMALSTYLPNLFTAYARTHSPTEAQTAELVQALTEANREFHTALDLVRAGQSINLETHTLFMSKRMAA